MTGHEVRTHTRKTASGKTTTVHQHPRNDGGFTEQEQAKRDRFSERVQRERHAAKRADQFGKPPARTPGERSKRKTKAVKRAQRHTKKAARLWRKHKVKAIGHGLAAAGIMTGWAAGSGARRAWKTGRKAGKALRKMTRRLT